MKTTRTYSHTAVLAACSHAYEQKLSSKAIEPSENTAKRIQPVFPGWDR